MSRPAAALALAALVATGCATRRGPAAEEAAADTTTLAGRTAVLEALERVVREQHVDPLFATDRFPAALERAQAPLLATEDAATFRSRLRSFVAGFGDPHFALLPPGADEAGLEVPGPGLLGAAGREVDGRLFVSDLHEGGPAALAGLRRGDEIVATDGVPPGSTRSRTARPRAACSSGAAPGRIPPRSTSHCTRAVPAPPPSPPPTPRSASRWPVPVGSAAFT